MATAKVFQSGNSQAVRIPKDFHIDSKEVEIYRRGDEIVLRPKRRDLREAFELLASLPKDFMKGGRRDLPPQKRNFSL